MAKVDWKTGKPGKDGVYLTTYGITGEQYWVVLTRFEHGEWVTSGDVIAWDYRPEPYEPQSQKEESVDDEYYTSDYVSELEWKVRDLESAWNEIYGEMKYHEGASEALHEVIKMILEV